MIGSLTHLTKQLCKKTKKSLKLQNDNRKENIFEREIFFRRNNSLEARIFVGWILKKTLRLKDPFFSSQSPKQVEIMFNFKKKMFSLKTLKRYVDYSFDNHAGNFSLIAKQTSLKILKKIVFFLLE